MSNLTIPWWMQVIAVVLQAAGLWIAGGGKRGGWLLALVNSAMWAVFAVVTSQWLLVASPLVMSIVKLRNWVIARPPSPAEENPYGV